MRHREPTSLWRRIGRFAAPSLLLVIGLIRYWQSGSVPHFFLHALMGWDVALILLLVTAYAGRPQGRFDGLVPMGLVLYAQIPDFIYLFGPYHHDWMDVFLFHISLDEILPLALAVLSPLWVILFVAYVGATPGPGYRFRTSDDTHVNLHR